MLIASILIPAYNCSNSIYKLLDSIPIRDDIEIILGDDGSIDNTLELIKGYRKKQIKILAFKNNHGVGFIRNKLLDAARGKWICWADSDDYFYTDELDLLLNNLYSLDDYNKINILSRQDSGDIRKYGCEPWSSLFSREIYDLLRYPEIRSAEDWYFKNQLKKLYQNKIKEYNYSKVVYHYSYHSDSLYQQKMKAKQEGDLKKFNYLEDPAIIEEYLRSK